MPLWKKASRPTCFSLLVFRHDQRVDHGPTSSSRRWAIRHAHTSVTHGLAGNDRVPTHMVKKQIEVPELLEMITDSGGHSWAWRMSAGMRHLDFDDLYDRVEAIISAAAFIEISAGAQMIAI